MTDVKTLVLDIETSPNLAYVWGLFKENIALSQLQQAGNVIAFAAKWVGEKTVEFHSDYDFDSHELTGHDRMIERAYELVDEADAIVHWNGATFDIPHLNREFLLGGFNPPSPHTDIDLLVTAKRRFRFVSNKLDNVAHEVLGERKVQHTGFAMWKRCMEGDDAAWRLMRKYNIADVRLTADLYDELKAWVPGHPHWGLYVPGDGVEPSVCGRCASANLIKRGYAYTAVSKFQRYRCADCGSWSRGGRRLAGVDVRPT